MKKLITEFIGTLFLVVTFGLSVTMGDHTGFGPIAIGAMLTAMTYMGYHISGAHFNPALSFAMLLRGSMTPRDAGLYILFQFFGALGGVLLVEALFYEPSLDFMVAPASEMISPGQLFLAEALFTFALALVFLHVTTSIRTENNSFYGVAMGLTYMAILYVGGGICGVAFNPAVGVTPNLIHGEFAQIWIYLLAPLAGAGLAALFFRFQRAGD